MPQIHITIMERWKEHYKEELDKILDFLNLKKEVLPLLPRHFRSYTVEPIKPQTIAMLKEFYYPYNKRLFKFIGYSIPEWGY